MDKGWYARLALFVGCIALAWLTLWPTLGQWGVLATPAWVSARFGNKIAEGLDIRGGLRLQYEVLVEDAVGERRDVRIEQFRERLCVKLGVCTEAASPTREQLERTNTRARIERLNEQNDSFRVTFNNSADMTLGSEREFVRSFSDLRDSGQAGNTLTMQLTNEAVETLRSESVNQARDTISNRIDELGVGERSVMSRDQNVIVELPGQDEAAFNRIRQIIARTARLEFRIVDDVSAESENLLTGLTDVPEALERQSEVGATGTAGSQKVVTFLVARGAEERQALSDYLRKLERENRLPSQLQLVMGRYEGVDEEEPGAVQQEAWRTYLLERHSDVTGDSVQDAVVQFDPQTQQPEVNIRFDGQGATAFERLTERNVQRRMAIVLDDKVESAPVIQTRIGGGRCRITMGGGLRSFAEIQHDAQDLVTVLRAGALPAPIRAANEQLIGPSLGADAVQQGRMGAIYGILAVFLFMGLYYQVAGIIANLMVLFNILFLLAILAAWEGTLTLPGIAGIALTVGMAVDANVLITERIREELRLGKSVRSAVEQGYDRAFWSIFDGQLTTAIAGIVLWQYGTGPLKGFATTLLIGIATSLFTGVFCSKICFDWLVRGIKVQRLAVG